MISLRLVVDRDRATLLTELLKNLIDTVADLDAARTRIFVRIVLGTTSDVDFVLAEETVAARTGMVLLASVAAVVEVLASLDHVVGVEAEAIAAQGMRARRDGSTCLR